jgi:hypothetical protein
MKFLMITNCPEMAAFAVRSGVDRIFIDLEILGKQERQGHLDTVISHHHLSDVTRVRAAVPAGQLLVRINPMHAQSHAEIDAVIAQGADILMLPMFRGPQEVAAFTQAVASRARTCLLAETVAAMQSLHECIEVPGVNEVHIGLNDWHLELGQHFMFEPLAQGLVDPLAAVLRKRGLAFGIGGLARVGEGLLPAELLLAEHVRLGSTAAMLSRTFHRQARTVQEIEQQMDFALEINRLRQAYAQCTLADPDTLQARHKVVQQHVSTIVASIKARSIGVTSD